MPTDKGKKDSGNGVKTLAIRLTEAQHAQLSLIAQLSERTLTEELRLAVEHWIEQSSSSPAFAARAQEALGEIERDAEARRTAITALFGNAESAKKGSGRKSGSSS